MSDFDLQSAAFYPKIILQSYLCFMGGNLKKLKIRGDDYKRLLRFLQKYRFAHRAPEGRDCAFWVVGLNSKSIVRFAEPVPLKNQDYEPDFPKELFEKAIDVDVPAVLITRWAGNELIAITEHDRYVAGRADQIGYLLGIGVNDYIVFNENNWTSIQEQALLG